MITGELTFWIAFLVGVLPSTVHVLIDVVPSAEFEVRVNGVELSQSPISSSELGILTFTTPELPGPGPASVSIATVAPGPGLICGESER